MSKSAIIEEVNQRQTEVCKALVKELYICDNCRKNKAQLFVCKWQNCVHIGRMLCTRCGHFVHDPDDTDHEFDPSASHIQKMSSNALIKAYDDPNNKALIKKRIKDMQMAAYSIEEKRNCRDRAAFLNDVTFAGHAINSLKLLPLVEYTDLFYKSFNEMTLALKSGAYKQFTSNMSKLVFGVSDEMLEYAKVCNEGAFAAAGIAFSAELIYQTFQLIKGNIGHKQFAKKLLVAASGVTGAAVGNIGGTAVGIAIGTFLCPGIGSSIGGAVGGLLGALFVGAKARQSLEDIKYFNDVNEQKLRMALINGALKAFGFSYKDIEKKKVFHKRSIAKKYRTRAMEAHPDRPGGSYEKFHALNAQMAILLALLEHNDNVKKETAKYLKAITL